MGNPLCEMLSHHEKVSPGEGLPTFLATKPDSYPSVGIAAKKGYWPLDHEALEPARTFLQSVAAAAN